MRYRSLFALGMLTVMWGFPMPAHAAAIIAGSIVKDIGPLAVAVQAILIIVSAIVVGGLGINSAMDFRRGDMAAGVYGVLTTMIAAVVLFVLIPAMIGGNVAAAAVVR